MQVFMWKWIAKNLILTTQQKIFTDTSEQHNKTYQDLNNWENP